MTEVEQEDRIKGLGRKETIFGMDRTGKLEKGCWNQM